jgi:hypothetical protein
MTSNFKSTIEIDWLITDALHAGNMASDLSVWCPAIPTNFSCFLPPLQANVRISDLLKLDQNRVLQDTF